ncbi:LysR substrate-binding domain-containing protein [Hominifimenecus sp. rT4P-3]|uniref:LysR substrate-binding domain-containing protein n=1 Tax=Hominifimenecus sp. rT4P-3 TaxID=3242979 RepID=UPI003DA21D08
MNLQQFYYFEAIARKKNYTKAAEELSTTQSCLSHSIADLEKELSLSLFYRKGKNIEITEFGLSFLDHVQKIIYELEGIKQDQQQTLAPFSDILKISFTANMSHEYIPNIIRAFQKTGNNQNIQFLFSEMLATKKAIEDLKNDVLDIAFGAKIENPDIDYFHIFDEELFLIVSSESAYAKQKSFHLEDIQKETLITYNYNCGTRYFIDKLFRSHNVAPASLIEVETEKMIASAVSSGLGIGMIPPISGLEQYNVKLLPLDQLTVKRPLYMMWKSEEYPRPAVKNFISFIKHLS